MTSDFGEDDWAVRWETARARALRRSDLADGTARIGWLARQTGQPWFTRLDDQPLSVYLECDAEAIMWLRGFGRVKRERLLAIIEAAVTGDPVECEPGIGGGSSGMAPPAPRFDPLARLAEWGVPEAYPTAVLLRLPARVLGFCEEAKIACLGDLVRATEALGEKRLLDWKNLGRKSVAELIGLVEALRRGDRQEAARWLPLSENGPGLSLGIAIKQLIADLDLRQRPMLERRLVQGMTLEEAAQLFGVTRERVRQIARDFLLEPLQSLLEAFPTEHSELFQRWMTGASPADHLGAFATKADRDLADGALRELFSDRPEAVAAKLNREMQFEELREKLRTSLEFHLNGIDLQSFLENELPVEQHGSFMESLVGDHGFALDHVTGRVGPAKPSLRRLVLALLAEEDEPIPATWLLRLVQQAKSFESLTLDELQGRYRGWAQRYVELTRSKVIWSE